MKLQAIPPQAHFHRQRKRSGSPAFWTAMLAGSVIIHLLILVLLIRTFQVRGSTRSGYAPISVEIVDAPLETNSSTATQATSRPTSQTTSRSTSVQSAAPTQETTAYNPPSAERSSPEPQQNSDSTITAPPNSPPPNSETAPASQQNSPTPPKSPTDPSTSSEETSARSSVNPDRPPDSAAPDPTQPSGPAKSGINLPLPPDISQITPNDPGQTAEELTEQTSISQNPVPAQYSASISVSPASGVPDLPDNPATLREDTLKTFTSDSSGCLLTPKALQSFNQEVLLRITVDEDGNVSATEEPIVQSSSGNPSYDELAVCVVKTWKFNPAYKIQGEVRSSKSSNLDVTVVIDQF